MGFYTFQLLNKNVAVFKTKKYLFRKCFVIPKQHDRNIGKNSMQKLIFVIFVRDITLMKKRLKYF